MLGSLRAGTLGSRDDGKQRKSVDFHNIDWLTLFGSNARRVSKLRPTYVRPAKMAIATRVFVFALSCGLSFSTFAGASCQKVTFSDSKSVLIRSAVVKHINAAMVAPEAKIFSITIVPPVDEFFADVSSIILEPQSVDSINRANVCRLNNGEMNCASFVTHSNMVVSVYFGASRTESRDFIVQKIRDYMEKEALVCP